ncbi:MAG: nitrophenyl compound nitroreductase subunit ArsF family protein [Bacteroidales bacterium]|nr:nitrophenyl compound nitroreductase subunit ArsF family protein [Bacteroidales bacterium]
MMALFMNCSCSAQTDRNSEKETVSQANDIEVYYFHYTRRCVTCQAVETVSGEALEELYGDSVPFMDYNLDETGGKEKAEELGISGQTLLIINGDKRINITNEGFMYARSNPEKLKQIISDHITPLL